MTELSPDQKNSLDEMVLRRMENTGETREEASQFLASYLQGLIDYNSQQ